MFNICIVQPNINVYSETFVRNHERYLRGNKFVLYGPWFPIFSGNENICLTYIKRNFLTRLLYYSLKILPVILFNRLPVYLRGDDKNISLHKLAFEFFLKKNKIDVVLAEFGLKGIVVMESCKKLNIPLVTHFHGGDLPDMDISQEYSSEFLRLFQISDAIVAVSKSMYNILIESGSFPNKTHLCPYGIDVDLFKLTVPSRNPLNFVCVGRFTEKKAPYLTILAFNEVLKIYPESKLIMIGGGSLVQVCKTIVESLNIQENVDFKGIMPVVEIVEELRSARAFVLHSLVTHEKDREGTPNVVIEASACGLPIVSTKHEGILDAVIHEKTGFLIKETDYLSMAKYMIELAKNEDLADELGQNGRYHILKNYNLNNSIAKLDNIIQSVLN